MTFACKHISTQHLCKSGRCRNDLLSSPRIGESRQSLNRLYPCNLGGMTLPVALGEERGSMVKLETYDETHVIELICSLRLPSNEFWWRLQCHTRAFQSTCFVLTLLDCGTGTLFLNMFDVFSLYIFSVLTLDSHKLAGTWYEGVTLDQPYSYQVGPHRSTSWEYTGTVQGNY